MHSNRQGAFFIQKMLISFLFLNKNIRCGYSLEAPRRGASNEYPQHMFSSRNKKNIMWIPPLICSYSCKRAASSEKVTSNMHKNRRFRSSFESAQYMGLCVSFIHYVVSNSSVCGVKAVIRMCVCAGWFWPLLSAYAQRHVFAWCSPTDLLRNYMKCQIV